MSIGSASTALRAVRSEERGHGLNKITLEKFLSDDDWWDNFKDSLEIPLDFIQRPKTQLEAENSPYVYDPYNSIVGHEKEKQVSNAMLINVCGTLARIRKMREDLKTRGMPENSPPGNCIIDRLREAFPTMPMIVREGPYGGSKTLQQECEEEKFFMMREEFGLTGYDYYTKRDKNSPLEFALVEKSSPGGVLDVEKYYDRKEFKRIIKSGFKKLAIYGSGGLITYVVAEILIRYWGLAQAFGIDPALWIADGVVTVLPYAQNLSAVAIAGILAYAAKEHFGRNKSKDLNLLATGDERPAPYVGHENVRNLKGEFMTHLDTSPQFKIMRAPDVLKANEKILIIENVHELSREVQQNLSQIIEEKYVDIADLSMRKFVYSLVSVGLNTEKMSQLEESLRNRLNYAERLNVRNEIERDEDVVIRNPQNGDVFIKSSDSVRRDRINERHLYVFLADRVSKMAGLPWKREACEELADYCSRLAEDVNKLRIDRGVVNVIQKANQFAKNDGVAYVEPKHIIASERDYRSLMQLAMQDKLKDYAMENGLKFKNDREVGVVRVLASYHDPQLQSFGKDMKKDAYEYARSEDYTSHPVEITATVEEAGGAHDRKPFINIVSKEGVIDKSYYSAAIMALFAKKRINLSKYDIHISIPSLANDDTLLCGAYAAIKSAIDGKPIRQDMYVSAKVLENGELTSVSRLYSRVFPLMGSGQNILISDFDKRTKVIDKNNRTIYPDTEFYSASDLDTLMNRLTD